LPECLDIKRENILKLRVKNENQLKYSFNLFC
jgi:hypothetical protein